MPLTWVPAIGSLRAGSLGQTPSVSTEFSISPVDLLDEVQTGVAERWNAVFDEVQQELFGADGSQWTLAELRALQRKAEHQRLSFAAWSHGEVVGALHVMLPLRDNRHVVVLWVAVVAAARGQGIGSALLARAEQVAVEHGRSTLLVESEWAASGADPAEQFAARRGYVVAQTMLRSAMPLPADRIMLHSILDAPGAEDHVIESFVDALPESWLEDLAVLATRMSTDAPTDDVDWQEEVWDADRVRAGHEEMLAAGRRVVESVARHVPTGRLVGFTRVEVPSDSPRRAYQQDTLVLTEHRGHRLGARLKAANVLLVMEALPEVRGIVTWNADSNGHMLAVNRALGYVPDGYRREWQKKIGSAKAGY